MGISCDMSIWSNPEELGSNEARHRFDQSLPCRIPDRFRNASSSPHGVSPVALRLLAFQDSFSPDGFDGSSESHRFSHESTHQAFVPWGRWL
ncbi:hypothetical protein F2Q69_00058980 [Brassica cretica]|uniref:Uncharacterized protein n=1 Tax=Brassica cretica TaxID=69181 RepID=A0A8S9RFG7_BRACR|nr:hypothetical protein F2Q69_00058980 [Brassica cretica]